MKTDYGRLSTTSEHLTYALIQEQRKTNELLQALLDQSKPKPTPAPGSVAVSAKPKLGGK